MLPGKRKRKYLIIAAILLSGIAVAIFALPLWFPWLLRPVAAGQGITYSTYERRGYSKFIVRDVVYRKRGTTLSIRRLEALVPSVWLWQRAVARDKQAAFALASDCELRSIRTSTSTPHRGVSPEARAVNDLLRALAYWMPSARITNGTIRIAPKAAFFSHIDWSRGQIIARARLEDVPGEIQLNARRSGPAGYSVDLSSRELKMNAQLRGSTNAAGFAVEGAVYWHSNRLDLFTQFGATGSLPQSATATAPQVHLRGADLGLPQYDQLDGAMSGEWHQGTFELDVNAGAEPLPLASNLPPLRVEVHAVGDTNRAIVKTARVISPALTAVLSREIAVHFKGEMLREPARLTFTSDLSKQKWIPVSGTVQGEADLTPGAARYPEARFRTVASDLQYGSFRARTFEARGRFAWPDLEIAASELVLADGSRASAAGVLELLHKSVSNAQVTASGPLIKRWLPEGYTYDSLSLTGQVRGPWRELSHTGTVTVVQASTPFLKPLDIHADWQGTSPDLDAVRLTLSRDAAALSLEGDLNVEEHSLTVGLGVLTYATNGEPALSLTAPTRITASRQSVAEPWHFQASPLLLSGKAGRVALQGSVQWPLRGDLQLGVQKLSSGIAAEFFRSEFPDVRISSMEAAAKWTNGPVHYQINLAADAVVPRTNQSRLHAGVTLSATGGDQGLALSNLVLSTGSSIAARATGFLPLTVSPGHSSSLLQFESRRELHFKAHTEPGSALWDELPRYTPVALVDPKLEVDLTGTWESPKGNVLVGANAINVVRTNITPLPDLRALQIALEFDRSEARLTSGRVLVQGQALNFAAQLPIGPQFWADLRHKKSPALERLSGRMRIEDAPLSAFEPLLPDFLAPQGEFTVDLVLHPERDLRGRLTLVDGRTQSLGPLGPIRGIHANLVLRDQILTIDRAAGSVGPASVSLTGNANLAPDQWRRGELPPFTLSVHGLGVPLARQPEFVVRGDLLLGLAKTNGAPPLITGTVRLHDSYYLSDLRALIPGKVASAERRPPYFSVETPLLTDWRLSVDVSGARFLRVRSPLFNGEISTNLKLLGSLKDPIALGDLQVDSGVVRFPFAVLKVQQGLVTLTSQDPYHPQLSVNAASKQFGYDIRMNVTGPIDGPMVQFSSTPPLSSEQILLMVSAGELPQGAFNLTPQQRAQTVALFLGRDLLAKLGVGDEGQQRLSIRSGEQISEQGRPTYRVEYKLSDDWSLTGEYDRFGDFNAGLKWRVFSK